MSATMRTHQVEQVDGPIPGLGYGLDRRYRPRLKLALPLVLFRSGEADGIETKTEDVSCDSFFCVSDHPFSLDDRLECELIIPGDKLSSVPESDLRVRYRARVVRVVANGLRGFGVACQLEDHTITRSEAD
jgi:hypothetical protein